MTKKTKTQRWIPSLIVAAALAGSAGLCQAQLISDSFDSSSDAAAWSVGAGTGTVEYNGAIGNPAGSLEVDLPAGSGSQFVNPQWQLPQTINAAKYVTVSFDYYVDPTSGVDETGPSYGYIQAYLFDNTFGWANGFGWTAINSAGTWYHFSQSIPAAVTGPQNYLMFQITANGAANSSTAIYYIDNVQIVPLPNPNVISTFTDNSVVEGASYWNAATINATWDTTVDNPYTDPVTDTTTAIPGSGSMEVVMNPPSSYTGLQLNVGFNAANWEYMGFDLYLDGPTGGTELGGLELVYQDSSWSVHNIASIPLTPAMVGKWTHFDEPCAGSGLAGVAAFTFQTTPGSDGGTNSVTFHLDNIQLWSPLTLPAIQAITPNTLPGGVKMAVDGPGDQYDRNSLCMPAGSNVWNYFWLGNTPATYSMSLTNFPSPAVAPQFEAHIFIANEDTCPAPTYNETAGSLDWNANDLLVFRVENGLTGGVLVNVEWKTNLPGANSPNANVQQFVLPNTITSANGTWTFEFTDNTDGTISKDGVQVAAFTMPDFLSDPNYTAIGNFQPSTSIIQWGVFKNNPTVGGLDSGDNDNQSYILASVSCENMLEGVPTTYYSDTFPGPGLTVNYGWRTSSSSLIQWTPYGIAYWLTWSLPDTGYSAQSAANLTGPWADAGITYTTPGIGGTTRLGAVPAASLPAANAGFFRLTNPSP